MLYLFIEYLHVLGAIVILAWLLDRERVEERLGRRVPGDADPDRHPRRACPLLSASQGRTAGMKRRLR